MEAITVRFTYTKDEYVRAVRQYLIATKRINRSSLVLIPAIFALSVFVVFAAPSVGGYLLLGLSLLALAMMLFIYRVQPPRLFARAAKLREPYTLVFSRDDIRFSTPSVSSTLQWHVYARAMESGDFLFLMQKEGPYTIIPKRALEEDGALEALRGMAQAALGPITRMAAGPWTKN